MTLEVNTANRAVAAEEAIDAYTNMLSSLEPLTEPWKNVDLTFELNSTASNPQQLLTGSNWSWLKQEAL